jgi:hypothetical protein
VSVFPGDGSVFPERLIKTLSSYLSKIQNSTLYIWGVPRPGTTLWLSIKINGLPEAIKSEKRETKYKKKIAAFCSNLQQSHV